MPMEYDLKITGGSIVDGTGQPAFAGEVGIRGGKIAALGKVDGAAARTIDAEGRAVAPGFVDIHTHYDAQVMWDRMMTISPWHGVTTVVMGNCGFGIAPTRSQHRGLIMRTLEKVEGMSLEALESGLSYDWPFETFADYLDAVERRGIAINAGAMVGHTPVRLYVMGEEATERPATADEIAAMRAIVRDAIGAGALGFATSKSNTHVGYSGKPVPSRAADFAEIKALAGALGEAGRGIMQATVGRELFFNEFAEISRATGRPVTWPALLAGMMGPGSHRQLLERNREACSGGAQVIPQVACRPLNFEFNFKQPFIFESMPLFKPVSAADFDGKQKIYRDLEFRGALKRSAWSSSGMFGNRWDRTWISHCPPEPALEERLLTEVARERGVDPIDLALDLSLASELTARFRMAVLNDQEDEVAELLNAPGTVLGLSDAGAHASQLCDACFSTYLLGRWVREKNAMPIEQAIWMLTARPAEVFGITDRGRLAPGMAADVTIFDPATVAAGPLRRVNDLPAGADRLVSDAIGIDAVIVNGVVIRRDGHDVIDPGGAFPGKVLRHGHARNGALR
jgi:N-acyl-D-amino-acid deacylase